MTIQECQFWDAGWCYKPGTNYVNGCVGFEKCRYINGKENNKMEKYFIVDFDENKMTEFKTLDDSRDYINSVLNNSANPNLTNFVLIKGEKFNLELSVEIR